MGKAKVYEIKAIREIMRHMCEEISRDDELTDTGTDIPSESDTKHGAAHTKHTDKHTANKNNTTNEKKYNQGFLAKYT